MRDRVIEIARVTVAAGLMLPVLMQTAVAHADPVATVKARTQRMSDANLSSHQEGWYNVGDKLTLVCSKRGQNVKGFFSFNIPGGWDNLWYQTSDGHFVADVDIETGTLNDVTGVCGDSRQAAPAAAQPTSGIAAFVANTNGQQIGDGQCVTLIKRYLSDVYGIAAGSWGNAIDYRSGGRGGNELQSRGFTWSNGRDFSDGDILVWQQDPRFAYLPQGHIATWYNGRIYDQNYAGRLTAGSDPFSGYGYLGRWRKTS